MENPAATPIERDVVLARGEDAAEYLHSQFTQDVMGLSIGDSAWSFLLQPKSEIVALVRITRLGDDEYAIDAEVGDADRILERIDGMLFRTDVTFSTERWPGVSWRGVGSEGMAGDGPIRMTSPWPGIEGVDLVGPDIVVPDGVERSSPAELDAQRIRVGWPSGTDFDDKTTPAMTGIVGHTVSFTKGCYTGQEFVARVHYREAAPPRRLVQVGFHPCSKPEPGDALEVDGEAVGVLTSVSAHQPLAMAYLKRAVDAPSEATVGGSPVCIGTLPSTGTVRAKPPVVRTTSPLTLG